MDSISILIIGLVLLFAITFLSNIRLGKFKLYLPYKKKEYMMTKAEHEFFKVLQVAVKDKYYIIPQVQLSRLVEVDRKWSRGYTYGNRINFKSVDFVLFNKEHFTPHLVIELDDSSHLRTDRQIRDKFVDSVLSKVGVKIVHVKNAYHYDLSTILNIIN